MKIGLFFGSFNPLHIGHKVIASYMSEFSDLQQVWFVVSPQNPLKQKQSLLDQYHRLMIIRMEVEDNPKLQVSDIEFKMPQPSYTIDTLVRLKEEHSENEYALIMGADNLKNFHKWKNYERNLKLIAPNYGIFEKFNSRVLQIIRKRIAFGLHIAFVALYIIVGIYLSFCLCFGAF